MMAPERTWETSWLLAKPAAVVDAQVVFDDYASDPAVAKYMTWTPHRSVADTKEFLSRCERVWIEGSAFPWSLWFKQDGAFVGLIEVRVRASAVDLGYAQMNDTDARLWHRCSASTGSRYTRGRDALRRPLRLLPGAPALRRARRRRRKRPRLDDVYLRCGDQPGRGS